MLVRQEAVFRFSAGFRLQIAQGGRTVFDRLYGMREDVKMWAFTAARLSGGMQLDIPGACGKELLVAECSWTYGSVENQLWEGVGTSVRLAAGAATITKPPPACAGSGAGSAPSSSSGCCFSMRSACTQPPAKRT